MGWLKTAPASAVSITAARRVPWSIARFASSSPACSAPPISKAGTPAALSGSTMPVTDSWPAHTTTWSTSRICSMAGPLFFGCTLICRPASSTLTYSTPLSIFTAFLRSVARCIQPVVLPSPVPSAPFLRWSRKTSRAGNESTGSRSPPRVVLLMSTPHSFMKAVVSSEVAAWLVSCVKYSATSNPIPPAPITATLFPGTGAPPSTSEYSITFE
mmetsp:Transcript_18152/g.38056  ORF Transcript_18152/g.38056 Transcript_18152/m.38056 type:complete len:214 (-) Transcript_18152:363-1004(-)